MGEPHKVSRIEVRASPHQKIMLDDIARQAGIGVSELIRRMLDFCAKPTNLNELFPCLSGSINVSG